MERVGGAETNFKPCQNVYKLQERCIVLNKAVYPNSDCTSLFSCLLYTFSSSTDRHKLKPVFSLWRFGMEGVGSAETNFKPCQDWYGFFSVLSVEKWGFYTKMSAGIPPTGHNRDSDSSLVCDLRRSVLHALTWLASCHLSVLFQKLMRNRIFWPLSLFKRALKSWMSSPHPARPVHLVYFQN